MKRCGQVLGNSEIVASTDESVREVAVFFGEHLPNNRLQMRDSGTTGKVVTLTKQTKIGPCEQVRVN